MRRFWRAPNDGTRHPLDNQDSGPQPNVSAPARTRDKGADAARAVNRMQFTPRFQTRCPIHRWVVDGWLPEWRSGVVIDRCRRRHSHDSFAVVIQRPRSPAVLTMVSRDQAPPEETLDGRVPDGGQGAAGSCDAMKAQLRVGV
jgi:hypothetical protein